MRHLRPLFSDPASVATYKADPDVIVGYEFLGVSLDAILDQMRDLKVDHWSQLGRFRRSNIKFLNGRLLCDSLVRERG